MPHYAKFMKDNINKKRKYEEDGVVNLSATYNAITQKNMPQKMQDPRSFTIPTQLETMNLEKLCVITMQA